MAFWQNFIAVSFLGKFSKNSFVWNYRMRMYNITVKGNPRFRSFDFAIAPFQILRSPSFLRFLVWSEVEAAVECARWLPGRPEIGEEKEATNSKRACRKWRTSLPENESRLHTVTGTRGRARELSASLGPVPDKSNYSKRDRKLLRSRSSLSIYTVRSDPWVGVEMYGGLAVPSLFLSFPSALKGWWNTRSKHTSVSLSSRPPPIPRFQLFHQRVLSLLLSFPSVKFGQCSRVRENDSFRRSEDTRMKREILPLETLMDELFSFFLI